MGWETWVLLIWRIELRGISEVRSPTIYMVDLVD